jgi:hypothetical protein
MNSDTIKRLKYSRLSEEELFLIETFNDVDIKYINGFTTYYKNDIILAKHNEYSNFVWVVDTKIWDVLYKKYKYDDTATTMFIENWFKRYFNIEHNIILQIMITTAIQKPNSKLF